jgi:hypothetical protein
VKRVRQPETDLLLFTEKSKSRKAKKPKNQKTKNPKTQKPKKPKSQKPKSRRKLLERQTLKIYLV